MQQGRMAKARRGELSIPLPRGFVRQASGEVTLDPDEQVRTAIQLVFDVFEQRRSVSGVLRYLVGRRFFLRLREEFRLKHMYSHLTLKLVIKKAPEFGGF